MYNEKMGHVFALNYPSNVSSSTNSIFICAFRCAIWKLNELNAATCRIWNSEASNRRFSLRISLGMCSSHCLRHVVWFLVYLTAFLCSSTGYDGLLSIRIHFHSHFKWTTVEAIRTSSSFNIHQWLFIPPIWMMLHWTQSRRISVQVHMSVCSRWRRNYTVKKQMTQNSYTKYWEQGTSIPNWSSKLLICSWKSQIENLKNLMNFVVKHNEEIWIRDKCV